MHHFFNSQLKALRSALGYRMSRQLSTGVVSVCRNFPTVIIFTLFSSCLLFYLVSSNALN